MKQVTIGVLLDADFDYGVGVLDGVRDEARGRPDWRVLPIPYAQEGLLTRLVRAEELQGVIGAFISDHWIESRFPSALPVVNTANLSQIERVCSVVPDDAAAGRLVARHFCELGYLHAGVISERATCASQIRREGFLRFMREQGVAVSEPSAEGTFRHESGWQTWLSELRAETAVFCTSDSLARRFWELCRPGSEVSMPPLVAVLAGVGDSLADRVLSGLDLTSVVLPARVIGQKAAARLARLLAGDQTLVRERIAPTDLIVRGSTARFSSADDVVSRAMGVALRNLSQNLSVAEVARRTGVSRRSLEQRFRSTFGRGPAQEFRARRMELAKRLLTETEMCVADIATRTGSGSVQAFTTLFKKTHGTPPAGFRDRVCRGECRLSQRPEG